jgi:hypothetical protein
MRDADRSAEFIRMSQMEDGAAACQSPAGDKNGGRTRQAWPLLGQSFWRLKRGNDLFGDAGEIAMDFFEPI